jgi:hypothetical protein
VLDRCLAAIECVANAALDHYAVHALYSMLCHWMLACHRMQVHIALDSD